MITQSLVLVDPCGVEVSDYIQDVLVAGYITHHAALHVARHPQAKALGPPIRPGQLVPTGHIPHKDAPGTIYDFDFYLDLAHHNDEIAEEMDRVWVYGALLRSVDLLGRHKFFDRIPEIELLRHLRNGVAHGNRFKLAKSGELQLWPANNKLARRGGPWRLIELDASADGQPVLFDFMAAGEVLSLLHFIGVHLRNSAYRPAE